MKYGCELLDGHLQRCFMAELLLSYEFPWCTGCRAGNLSSVSFTKPTIRHQELSDHFIRPNIATCGAYLWATIQSGDIISSLWIQFSMSDNIIQTNPHCTDPLNPLLAHITFWKLWEFCGTYCMNTHKSWLETSTDFNSNTEQYTNLPY